MTYFENKYIQNKDNIYLDYQKILNKSNLDYQTDIYNFLNPKYSDKIKILNPCILNNFIFNFYEFDPDPYNYEVNLESFDMYEEDLLFQKLRKNIEFSNKQKTIIGVENYNVVLFNSFPIQTVKYIINQTFFQESGIFSYLFIEIKKFLYTNWNNPELSDITQKITNILENEYWENQIEKSTHQYSWLLCFLPLLNNGEELIFKLVNTAFLTDTQDELLEGIKQMESNRLLEFYKKFLLAVWKSSNIFNQAKCFELWSWGTSALEQNCSIISKLQKELNWNIFEDSDLKEFWEDEANKSEIEEIKEYLK